MDKGSDFSILVFIEWYFYPAFSFPSWSLILRNFELVGGDPSGNPGGTGGAGDGNRSGDAGQQPPNPLGIAAACIPLDSQLQR